MRVASWNTRLSPVKPSINGFLPDFVRESGASVRGAESAFIKNARTPTLILVGEKDIETPTPQSYEFWKGLLNNGVETEFVVYADEGHRMTNPVHVRDRVDRSIRWFDKHLKATPVP